LFSLSSWSGGGGRKKEKKGGEWGRRVGEREGKEGEGERKSGKVESVGMVDALLLGRREEGRK
jgi:hypothetical protein